MSKSDVEVRDADHDSDEEDEDDDRVLRLARITAAVKDAVKEAAGSEKAPLTESEAESAISAATTILRNRTQTPAASPSSMHHSDIVPASRILSEYRGSPDVEEAITVVILERLHGRILQMTEILFPGTFSPMERTIENLYEQVRVEETAHHKEGTMAHMLLSPAGRSQLTRLVDKEPVEISEVSVCDYSLLLGTHDIKSLASEHSDELTLLDLRSSLTKRKLGSWMLLPDHMRVLSRGLAKEDCENELAILRAHGYGKDAYEFMHAQRLALADRVNEDEVTLDFVFELLGDILLSRREVQDIARDGNGLKKSELGLIFKEGDSGRSYLKWRPRDARGGGGEEREWPKPAAATGPAASSSSGGGGRRDEKKEAGKWRFQLVKTAKGHSTSLGEQEVSFAARGGIWVTGIESKQSVRFEGQLLFDVARAEAFSIIVGMEEYVFTGKSSDVAEIRDIYERQKSAAASGSASVQGISLLSPRPRQENKASSRGGRRRAKPPASVGGVSLLKPRPSSAAPSSPPPRAKSLPSRGRNGRSIIWGKDDVVAIAPRPHTPSSGRSLL